MRAIKFRAWDGKKMFRVTMLYLTQKGLKIGGGGYLQIEASKVKLMQASGLKDARGTDIYEGDILAYGDGPGIVVMEYDLKHLNCGFVIRRDVSPATKGRVPMPLGIPVKQVMRVIGNIYENPEILKEAQNAK